MRRRDFSRSIAGMAALSSSANSQSASTSFDPEYATASAALEALAARRVTSAELVRHLLDRIHNHNHRVINAFTILNEERAIADAKASDVRRASSRNDVRPLEGLPITIKDAFATAGLRTTAGSKSLDAFVPKEDAVAVAKLRQAGAIIIGKTNLPEFSADIQSYNAVSGVTNNPWDLKRTPGGSTGGGAAAVASGFTYLELGSDSGGSIRIPAHYSGVFGHKSSVHLVSRIGWIPPMPGQLKGPNDISVSGPLARSAADLRLMLRVAAGRSPDEDRTWKTQLPAPRHRRLKDFRLGFVLDDAYCPLGKDSLKVLDTAVAAIRRTGVAMEEGWPAGVALKRSYEALRFLTTSYFAATIRTEDKEALKGELNGPHDEYARATLAALDTTYVEWEKVEIARLEHRHLWHEYFRTHDAFLMPVAITPAILHDHSMPRHRRVVTLADGSKRGYMELSAWIAPAGLPGLPATVIPAGLTAQGLPVGLQIVGPYLEDLTPIELAEILEKELGGFRKPPMFQKA